jgi:predicted component of type VI protein secretion system
MSFLFKKHLSRRTFLRGAGVTLSLPFLESMVPAWTPVRLSAATPKTRLGCFYVPHGATMYKWTPAAGGKGFQFSEILSPLEKYRDRVTVVSNLAHQSATGADAGAEHARSAAIYLSGGKPQKNAVRVGVTMDQIAAMEIGQDTPLPSLELGIEDASLSCGAGYGCAYFNTISWRTPTAPLPVENSPQAVFEKLFGDGGTAEQRMRRKREDRSILDSIRQQTTALQNDLPASDRARVDGYLEDIREIERRIKTVIERGETQVVPAAPVGTPETFDEHIKLMFDLLALAWQSETTRVSTLMYAKDLSPASYPASGNRGGFHGASHHANARDRMDSFALINKYHVQMFDYFLTKLAATNDGDGTLLDHSMILYGSSMSNGNQHDHGPLPLVLVGGASGQLEGNRHIVAREGTPMANLLLSMLDKVGVKQDSFGDSTGRLEI